MKKNLQHKLWGTKVRPRLSVNRSAKHIFCQLIDDDKGVTLVASSDLDVPRQGTKSERSFAVGEALAKNAKIKKIKKVVFDRGNFLYKGRVKSLAEGARKGGLEF